MPPRRDLRLETLHDILDGKILVHAHCYRADEILMLIRVADEFGFKIRTFQHVLEGYKVASEIAQHGAGASHLLRLVGLQDGGARTRSPTTPRSWRRKGVRVSLNSDSDELARRLYWEAAKAVKYGGVSEAEALQDDHAQPGVAARRRQARRARSRRARTRTSRSSARTRSRRDARVRDDAGGRAGLLRPREGPGGSPGDRRAGAARGAREVRSEGASPSFSRAPCCGRRRSRAGQDAPLAIRGARVVTVAGR